MNLEINGLINHSMKKIFEKIKNIDFGTILRTILQIAIYINQFIAILGNTSFASSPVYQWISFGITVVITIITYWFNNDWSKLALVARDIFDMMKDGKITEEEVKKFIEDHSAEKHEDKSK